MPDEKYTSESDEESSSNYSIDYEKRKPKKNKYKCSFDGCNLTFKRMTFLDRHEYTHTGIKKHVCKYENCDKSYKIITLLKRHIKTFHEKWKPSTKFKCPIDGCNKYFVCNENVERHIKQVHGEKRMYLCPSCPLEFNRKIQLRKHIITHTGKHPFKCDICLKKFIYPALYERHICERKVYKCETCNEEFDKWTLLVKHKKSSHIPVFKCTECGKEFKTNNNLKKHTITHKDPEEKFVHMCPWEGCSRFYHHARNLKVHIKTKHEGKKFECTHKDCSKTFATNQKLKNHLRLHETELETVKKSKIDNRQKRRDAGEMKASYVSILSGIVLDPQTDKLIKNRKNGEVFIDFDDALQNLIETTDTESEDVTVKRKIVLQQSTA